MKKLFSPKFSLLFITLPQALLAAALVYVYTRVELTPSLPLMIVFGVQVLFNAFIVACAALNLKRKHIYTIQLTGFIVIISVAAPFLLEQFDFATSLSPEAIYGTLCLIPLIYIATAILHYNEIPLMNVKKRIILCVCVPLFFAFIPLLALGGLLNGVFTWVDDVDWLYSAASILIILLFALFFVFVCLLTSILYHFRTKKPASVSDGEAQENRAPKKYSEGYYVFIVVLALILPLVCLLINNEFLYGDIFGDFSGKWFYILAFVNGLTMLIPRKNKWLTLITLFFKSAGFLYVFYFVVVMLPYAPLGVAFYAYLLPLLVLTPAALFTAELFQIIDDFRFLKQHFSVHSVLTVFACGMLTLCAGFIGNGYIQKVNFDNAMCYLNRNETILPDVNVSMLNSSIRYMRRSDQFWSRAGDDTHASLDGPPILSEIYNRMVFGGQILNDNIYEQINRMFLPDEAWNEQPDGIQAAETLTSVKLRDVKTETRFDKAAGVYKIWVHLTLKNETSEFDQEYAVNFTLPDGVFVSDYYLDVYGKKKHGIVAEKNTAKSIYSSIVSRNRDPGIIYYEGRNTIELRVFPFGAGETRETGFELMFLQSDSFNIGKHTINLEGKEITAPVVTGGTCFMPASYKANLDMVSARTPKYYFIADIRKPPLYDEEYPPLEKLLAQIRDCAQRFDAADADVYLTCYNVRKTDLENLDAASYGEGGFNLALAMDMIYEDAKQHPDSYPVIMVSTGNIGSAAVADNSRFPRDFPEIEFYCLINSAGNLKPYSFVDNIGVNTAAEFMQTGRLSYEGFYFRDDGQNEVSYNNTTGFADISYGSDIYTNALLLSEKIVKAGTDDQVIETVKDGISRRLLTKNNSFIVLETKEQEDELNRRNQEFLDGNAIGASAAPMSEPGLLIALLFAMLLLILLRFKRKKRFAGNN